MCRLIDWGRLLSMPGYAENTWIIQMNVSSPCPLRASSTSPNDLTSSRGQVWHRTIWLARIGLCSLNRGTYVTTVWQWPFEIAHVRMREALHSDLYVFHELDYNILIFAKIISGMEAFTRHSRFVTSNVSGGRLLCLVADELLSSWQIWRAEYYSKVKYSEELYSDRFRIAGTLYLESSW